MFEQSSPSQRRRKELEHMQWMQPQNNQYAARLIRFKARQLCRRPGFTPSDRADIEQEFRVDLLERLPRFDAGKAQLNTFIARVIERKAASIVRHRTAEKRAPEREECSLND
ncbi:MAG: hypothetical protein D6760_05195, partial [Deltaproteobacteria bacterium]